MEMQKFVCGSRSYARVDAHSSTMKRDHNINTETDAIGNLIRSTEYSVCELSARSRRRLKVSYVCTKV